MIWELHARGTTGHLEEKTIDMIEDRFYWPSLKRDVTKIIKQCRTWQLAKRRKQNTELYMALPVPHEPWQDLRMDFFLSLPKNSTG